MINYCTIIPTHDGTGIHYIDIYPSIIQVKMCIEPGVPIYKIDVMKTNHPTEDSYWAWQDPDGYISLVYYAYFLVDMCFPDGAAAEERAKRGLVIRVDIENVEEATQ